MPWLPSRAIFKVWLLRSRLRACGAELSEGLRRQRRIEDDLLGSAMTPRSIASFGRAGPCHATLLHKAKDVPGLQPSSKHAESRQARSRVRKQAKAEVT